MAGAAANLMNLKPIVAMSEYGKSKIFDKAFSRRGVLRKTLRHLRADGGGGRRGLVPSRAVNRMLD